MIAVCSCRPAPPYDVAHVEHITGPWLTITICALILGVVLVLGVRERHLERLRRRARRNRPAPKHRNQPDRTGR